MENRDLTPWPSTGATSFHIWYPVRPRSWNLPEKEIRASFTCSRALYVCSSRGENIDAPPPRRVASRAPLVSRLVQIIQTSRGSAHETFAFRSPFELRETVSWLYGTEESRNGGVNSEGYRSNLFIRGNDGRLRSFASTRYLIATFRSTV